MIPTITDETIVFEEFADAETIKLLPKLKAVIAKLMSTKNADLRKMPIIRVTEGQCWEAASEMERGYKRVSIGGKSYRAHRWFWVEMGNRMEAGKELDHLCRNRACCNPNHLELVTHDINVYRGKSSPANNRLKTHCKNGHEFTESNTFIKKSGHRNCRKCTRELRRLWKLKNS